MTIEERWPCPRCSNRKRVRWPKQSYYCFNCRNLSPSHEVEFTDAELARLTMYRAAVRTGLYSEEMPLCT